MGLRVFGRQLGEGIDKFLIRGSDTAEVSAVEIGSGEMGSSASKPALNPEQILSRLPFSQPRFLTSLAAKIFGQGKIPAPETTSGLTKSQEKLLQGTMSVEAAAAELSLLKTVESNSLDAAQAEALLAYRKDLTARAEGLASRLGDELIELEDRISHQTDLLSGNEEENEGLSEVEAELEILEIGRSELEKELESLATFQEGLGLLEVEDREVLLEEMTGTASDLLELEAKYLQRDWDRALEVISEQTPRLLEVPHIQEQLLSLDTPSVEGMETLILLQAQAELWAVTEARIEQFGEMMKVAGITDGIINLGGLTMEDLTFAQEYSHRQSDYSKVLRYLAEGKPGEALELFQGLEGSRETEILFEAFEDAEKINACTVNALTVVGAGAAARLAMPIVRGLALMGNVSSKAVPALQFGAQVGTFTLAHRQLNGWVMDQPFFDPNLSPIQNAEALSQEFLFNAGMFAFLGMSQKLFVAVEGKALQGLAKRKGSQASLKTYGPMTIEAEAASELFLKGLQKSQLTKLAHVSGSFGTELVGFGAWDYLAANLQGLASGDYNAKRIFAETLGSKDKWEHNLVFIAALKAGGALASPVFRPMNRSAEGFAKAKYRDRLAELDQTARDCAQALEGHLEDPRESLELLARYEASLEGKLSFLRDIPSELSHPAGLELLNAEIKSVRELSRAIEAGVFDAPANDGDYGRLPPRIEVKAYVAEAANDGKYPTFISPRMRLASGAEEYHSDSRDTFSPERVGTDAPDAAFHGLRTMAMGAGDSSQGVWHRLGRSIGRLLGKSSEVSDPQPFALRGNFSGDGAASQMREVPILYQLVPWGVESGRGKITVTPDAKISLLGQRLSIYLFCQIIEFSPRPELIKRGQYAVMSWLAEAFAGPSLSSLQVIDLSAWNLEPSWESAIRTFAFAHPNLVRLGEIRIGRRVFHAEEGVEAVKQTENAAMQEVTDEYENGPGKGLYLDKDAHPAQRLQWLRFAQLYHLVKLGDPAYVQEVSEVLKVIRDPRVSRKAMRGSVLPMERPGGYPHALRLEAARVFVEAVELSGSGELAELGVSNLREILMEPKVSSHYEGAERGKLSPKERSEYENMVREDLFPFLLRLLPYLPTDSSEVTAGFTMLGKADWIMAWGEAHPHPPESAPPVVVGRTLDEVYRERPEAVALGPRKIHPCVQVGLAYAGYLAAASPFQLELSKDLRMGVSERWSAWLLSDMSERPKEVARAVAIWAKHHDEVARAFERLPVKQEFRDEVSNARDEVNRVSRRRLDELMEKRVQEWGATTGMGAWVRFLLGMYSPWNSLSRSHTSKSETERQE